MPRTDQLRNKIARYKRELLRCSDPPRQALLRELIRTCQQQLNREIQK